MTYSFRQRFEVAQGGRLPFEEKTLVLHEHEGVSIELRSILDEPLSTSTQISIWGSGFGSPDEARSAGEHWRSAMQRALAGVDIGANFGLRNPSMGGFTDVVIQEVKASVGLTIIPDSWDVMVFPSDPPPRFSSGSAEGYISSPVEVVLASITSSVARDEQTNEVAFDLFTASMRAANMADVRVVLLIMAIECLVQQVKRPEPTRLHIDSLVSQTLENEDLDLEEREALANALRGLRNESTRRAVKTMAQQLDPARYNDEPTALMLEAFDMRNALVHGRTRPDLDRVRYVGAKLERLVGDLIAGPSVAEAVDQARRRWLEDYRSQTTETQLGDDSTRLGDDSTESEAQLHK